MLILIVNKRQKSQAITYHNRDGEIEMVQLARYGYCQLHCLYADLWVEKGFALQ